MSDTWNGGSRGATTSWFTARNWSTGAAPTISATGNESVIISGTSAHQPVIPATETEITVNQTVFNNGTIDYTALTETQIGGEFITLTTGANLTIQGDAMGVFYGNTDTITAAGGTMTGLHGALSTKPSFDAHMSVIAIGNDTLTVETVNENFGLITVGNGDTLTIYNTYGNGANPQDLHGLINYGLITVGTGGHLTISAASQTGSTIANFYNAGWIVVDGGTLSISSAVVDGANTIAPSGSVDGYIEIGGGGDAILSNTVGSAEEVTFTDTMANTLQITAGTLFSGTVNDFGASDTIVVNGFTSTSNATITTVGGVTELITANGSVLTTITLTGSITTNITAGTNSSGQEIITTGGNTLANATTYAGSTTTLTGTGGTLTNNGTVAVTGAGTELVIDSTVAGTGSFFIDYGATLALDNPTGNDAGESVTFGTHGSVTAPNTLIINDNATGFGGKVIDFGAHDDIVLGGSALPALTSGEGIALSYNTTTGVLTVNETNASGTVIDTSTVSIAGIAGLSTGSFIELEGSTGLNIELAPTASTSYNFSTTGTGSFENYADYTGGVAPGDVLSPNMTVAIAAGTASVSSGGVTDNGLITVASGATFLDNGSLTGTGTLAVGAGGSATLGGSTTLGSVTDNGTITDNGGFTDNGALTGTGTLVVGAGHYAQFVGSVALGAILDSGAIGFLGAAATGTINMEGNNAGSSVVFGGTGSGTDLINFGTNDLIGLGTTVLTLPVPGTSGALLNYNTTTGVLTIEDTANSTGSIISTANVTVSGVSGNSLTTGAFVALETAHGVEIELAGSTNLSPFTFSVSGTGSFEAPASYTGGTAPGDVIATGETVVIAAGTAAVSNAGVTDNALISISSGASFLDAGKLTGTGTLAVGAGGSATLTGGTSLGSITDAGSLTLGGTDATAITLATGAQATIASNFADTSAITGAGTLTVKTGVTGTLASGSSLASVLDSGTLNLAGSMGGSINMQGNGAGSVADFLGADLTGKVLNTALTNFGTGDKIILGAADFALNNSSDVLTDSYNSGTGQLTVTDSTNGSSVTLSVGLGTNDTGSMFKVSDSTGALVITLCFYPGTKLATPEGEIAVEDIKAGDMLMTANGALPVRWIGQSHIHTRFADPLRSLPIRITQGALGDGLPMRDLLLSPDHAICIDDMLMQASALVNGTSIVRESNVPEQFTYYHVELASHELLLAEGVPAESFVDNVERTHFHNWDSRIAPAEAIMEMDMPRAKSARQVPTAIRHRLGLDKAAVA